VLERRREQGEGVLNAAARYFVGEWRELAALDFPAPSRVVCHLKTPRFRASSHVLFFVYEPTAKSPFAVIKMSRLTEESEFLERESANLARIQTSRPGGFDSIPRLIAYERTRRPPFLVESFLSGEPMSPSYVRARGDRAISLVVDWLRDLHRASATAGSTRLVSAAGSSDAAGSRTPAESSPSLEESIERAELLVIDRDDEELLRRTGEILAPLRAANLTPVFEHGDLSSPNLLVTEAGRLAVVDWELADARGLPVADLFFFLTYVAFARGRPRDTSEHVAACTRAFFGASAWARCWVLGYIEELGIPRELLGPLFVATWLRYVTSLVERLGGKDAFRGDEGRKLHDWLLNNRYRAIWRASVDLVSNSGGRAW
jgi:aminoglycoside phosphotransferase (APT) family kinase protein